ncbi:MAG: calcium-binding protein [Acidimicrobiales bacterium]
MSSARPTTKELDALIEEVTVDAYNDSEQLTAFETAFDEVANFPCQGTVIGEDVEVLSLAADDDRGELVATCRRAGRRYKVALREIDLRSGPDTLRLVAAYKRWLSP